MLIMANLKKKIKKIKQMNNLFHTALIDGREKIMIDTENSN